jgi:hypothetical protein
MYRVRNLIDWLNGKEIPNPMERELFDWTDWDGDSDCMTFYNAVLKKQIGSYPVGTKFDGANVMWDKGLLQFYRLGEPEGNFTPTIVVAQFRLHLEVGEQVYE